MVKRSAANRSCFNTRASVSSTRYEPAVISLELVVKVKRSDALAGVGRSPGNHWRESGGASASSSSCSVLDQLGCATMVTRRFSGAAGSLGLISALEPLPTALMRSVARPCEPVR